MRKWTFNYNAISKPTLFVAISANHVALKQTVVATFFSYCKNWGLGLGLKIPPTFYPNLRMSPKTSSAASASKKRVPRAAASKEGRCKKTSSNFKGVQFLSVQGWQTLTLNKRPAKNLFHQVLPTLDTVGGGSNWNASRRFLCKSWESKNLKWSTQFHFRFEKENTTFPVEFWGRLFLFWACSFCSLIMGICLD